MDTAVIIAGAGPVGLMLAAELRLGGVEVVVFERRAVPSGESRGLGFTARAAEIFEQRGLLKRFENAEPSRQGHFGGVPMDFGILEGAHFGVRGVPQHEIECVLEDRALELGASVLRGYEVVGLSASDNGVAVVTDGPQGRAEHTADYLVGCDGGRSTIRQLGGFAFPGTDATREMYLADVAGCDIRPRFIGERVAGGMVMAAPLGDGVDRIIICENGTPPPDGSHDLTFAEVADAWQRLTGQSLYAGDARWVSSFTDATRQAAEYRRGRVLLAGDAAHIHLPAGGQGLSVGVQDAANLGWKLAATVRGWASSGLLDTYHDERHPVGQHVLRNTLAQGTLYLSGTEVEPLRSVMAELMAFPDVARHLAGMVSGFDIRYDVGQPGHPLAGGRMPDRELRLRDAGTTRVAQTLHQARGVFIASRTVPELTELAAAWADRVDVVEVERFPAGPEDQQAAIDAALIRPDGYVAWAAPGDGDLRTALARWFGDQTTARDAPSTPPVAVSR